MKSQVYIRKLYPINSRQSILNIHPHIQSVPCNSPIPRYFIRHNSSFPPTDIRSFPKRDKAPAPNAKTADKSTAHQENKREKKTFRQQISAAWATPTKWYPIPVALGAVVLLAVQWRKRVRGELEVESQREGAVVRSKRKVDGPWQVRVLGALPLRSLSQLWGYLNSLVLPVWFRPTGFKIYAWIFGCNLEECVPEDLTQYASLGEFFYRELKAGVRPIADAPMVSPADGRVLHFGQILDNQVEQVKGLTYSLDALLGSKSSAHGPSTSLPPSSSSSEVVDHTHFAEINDISYSLSDLLGTSSSSSPSSSSSSSNGLQYQDENQNQIQVPDPSLPSGPGGESDASHYQPGGDLSHDTSVAVSLGSSALSNLTTSNSHSLPSLNPDNSLYFLVIYLAPGDYHRFHSPVPWVVERRRHFTGDLFSVSPYIANRLKDLFVLNERVALLGRWKYGFFSMVPVGATNVGSIRINFDETLRTNTRRRSHPVHTFTEAVYGNASKVLGGQPLLAGEEMGGFKLGSTIVLVFEAPKDWEFTVRPGDKVKVGQALGTFDGEK
ncbi:phosphatidylserine decarboxylase [Tremella mesenterica]|uniref:Phosphatidylserine decarboxylase proenzyme 1, mitochondrial n=1 Tax=Tremella mesenterica TaxID=5217 RepID=A0A4Q1BW79_TREME|nr:phosphatidylserine decarboxylase [Tremella mesenterica]